MLFSLVINGKAAEVRVDDPELLYCIQNDTEFAYNFVGYLINQDALLPFGVNKSDLEGLVLQSIEVAEENGAEEGASQEAPKVDRQVESVQIPLWSTRRNTQIDIEATLLLLQLRKEYDDKFNDKTSAKLAIWQQIAVELRKKYYLGESMKGSAEKCRQKFANLQKMYIRHITYLKTTGKPDREPPVFFDMMHSILGKKHDASPSPTVDPLSLDVDDAQNEPSSHPGDVSSATSSAPPSPHPSVSDQSETMFTHVDHTTRQSEQLHLDALYKMYKQTLDVVTKTCTVFQKHMTREYELRRESVELQRQQVAQTGRLAGILETYLRKKLRKRRRDSSDSD